MEARKRGRDSFSETSCFPFSASPLFGLALTPFLPRPPLSRPGLGSPPPEPPVVRPPLNPPPGTPSRPGGAPGEPGEILPPPGGTYCGQVVITCKMGTYSWPVYGNSTLADTISGGCVTLTNPPRIICNGTCDEI